MGAKVVEPASEKEIETAIQKAMQKVHVKSELLLSRFIPGKNGHREHHLTIAKIKKNQPQQLLKLLEKYILSEKNPKAFPSPPRLRRESKTVQVSLTRDQVARLIEIVKASGDQELFKILASFQSPSAIKQQVKKMISEGNYEPALMELYNNLVAS